jgi:hypothetical protein
MAFAGVAYRAQWQGRGDGRDAETAGTRRRQGRGDFTFGVQRESYDKNVLFRDLPPARLTDHPLRAYGNAALAFGERVTACEVTPANSTAQE